MFSALFPFTKVEANAKTIVVPDNYRTITDAIGNATNGDVILVRSGFYSEIQLDSNVSLSLIGQGASTTTISLHPPIVNTTIGDVTLSGYASPIQINANNVVISGFTITSTGGNLAINGNNAWLANNDLAVNIALSGNYETVTNNTLNLSVNPILGIGIGGSYSKICQNTGTGLIAVGSGSYNNVFANTITGEIGGFGTSYSNLYYNNVVDGGMGMSAATGDFVANNTVENCDHGISIVNGYNNLVIGNTVANNAGAGLIKKEGLANLFYANYVANNGFGVQIGSNQIGNTTLYDNDFINNSKQVQYLFPGSIDHWNENQGNYWSDYSSKYPNASQIDSSGIWDTPYNITNGEQDNYPLISPFDISTINTQLPIWGDINNPTPLQLPSFPPQKPLSSPTSTPVSSFAPTMAPSPSSTPTVPELSWLVLVPLLLSVFAVAVIVKHRKDVKAKR